jgi:hypothetical protein
MIGRGMPMSQSSAPFPKVMVASICVGTGDQHHTKHQVPFAQFPKILAASFVIDPEAASGGDHFTLY